MKTPPFEYHAPADLAEGLDLLAENADEAKILAGGQSLMPLLAMRLARPSHLIDLNRVPGLDRLESSDGQVRFGALVRERAAERSEIVRDRLPLLAEALPLIGHVAIRNRGTLGGSLAHADAASELPAVALVSDAEMVVRSARGERTIPAGDFFEGHFTTAMSDDECLVEVTMRASQPGTGWSCMEIARRHGDYALVGVVTTLRLDGAGNITDPRIALFGVADRAVRAGKAEATLNGSAPSGEAFAAAAADAAADLDPASDVHASGPFRRHLAGVVVRRALARAAERASQSPKGGSR